METLQELDNIEIIRELIKPAQRSLAERFGGMPFYTFEKKLSKLYGVSVLKPG
jgi:hypothetical protein